MPTVLTRPKARCRPLVLGTSWAPTSTLTTTLAVANPADFYKGKTVTYIVATSSGGSCDLTGRLVADFMQKQLPGLKFVDKNVPGASKEPVPFATGNEGEMARRRGEVFGEVGSRSSWEGFVKNGYGRFIVQIGGKDKDIPQLSKFVTDPSAKAALALVQSHGDLARPDQQMVQSKPSGSRT